MDDSRIEFLEILKHGRDTRPERVWCLVGAHQLQVLGYDNVQMSNEFGVVANLILQRWPEQHDLPATSAFAEIFTKAWVKYALGGVLPGPRNEYYLFRGVVFLVFADATQQTATNLSTGAAVLLSHRFSEIRNDCSKEADAKRRAKEAEAARKKAEREAKKRQREEILAKLTPEERELLGL